MRAERQIVGIEAETSEAGASWTRSSPTSETSSPNGCPTEYPTLSLSLHTALNLTSTAGPLLGIPQLIDVNLTADSAGRGLGQRRKDGRDEIRLDGGKISNERRLRLIEPIGSTVEEL